MNRNLLSLIAGMGIVLGGAAHAEISGGVVKIGVLTDMSGPYSGITGPSSVSAARMAVADYLKSSNSKLKIEVVFADHQHKPDLGSAIARKWYDNDGVDMIVDVPNSAVGLAVNQLTKDKNKVFVNTGSGSTEMTGKYCSPNSVSWLYSTWMIANGTASALTKQGEKTWFFLTADYAFGKSLENDASQMIEKQGGKVLGQVRMPLGTTDFSSFLLQAQSSKAQVIALANASTDAINTIKQANEFGISKAGQKIAALAFFMQDIHAMGLDVAQGLYYTTSFYWDLNEQTRSWAKRFAAENTGKYPGEDQAGVYSGVINYLKIVDQLQNDADGVALVRALKQAPIDDPLFGKSAVRDDGRYIHPAYLFQVKKPAESKAPYDLLRLVEIIPAEKAFRPMSEGGCDLVKK